MVFKDPSVKFIMKSQTNTSYICISYNFYDIANPLLYLNKIVEEHKVYFLKKKKKYINTHI